MNVRMAREVVEGACQYRCPDQATDPVGGERSGDIACWKGIALTHMNVRMVEQVVEGACK
jgi:hypothetical protein